MTRRVLALFLSMLLGACGGGDPNRDSSPQFDVVVQPATVVVRYRAAASARVDVPDVAEADLPAGYAFDLDEVVGDIAVTTAPCPPGEGSRACQDWTFTPGPSAVPGDYEVDVDAVGSRFGKGTGSFKLTVVADPAPANGAAVAVASDGAHVLVLNDAGRVFVKGANRDAQSRAGYRRQPRPGELFRAAGIEPAEVAEFTEAPLPPGNRWRAVGVGADNSFAVRDDGGVWAWGHNPGGHLGFASPDGLPFQDVPQQVVGLAGVRALAFAREPLQGNLALLADGTVWYWDDRPPSGPAFCEWEMSSGCLRPMAGVQAVAYTPNSFSVHAALLKNDGSVWEGESLRLQRVAGAPEPVVAIAITGKEELVMAGADGSVWVRPPDGTPMRVPGLDRVTAVSARPSTDNAEAFALRSDGSVWAWVPGAPAPAGMPQQVAELARVVALGAHYAISGDCSAGGALWRIDRASAEVEAHAVRLPGFGEGPGCTPPASVELALAITGQGRVVSAPAGLDCAANCSVAVASGTELRLHAQAAVGWHLSEWLGDGCSALMVPTSALHCEAVFRMAGERRLTVRVNGRGRVISFPAGIDCGRDCTESYSIGTSVTLRAVPERGYQFDGFSGDADCTDGVVFVRSVRSCVATFSPLPAPVAPTGFAATAAPVAVQLHWDAVDGPVVGYRLERADPSGSFELIATGIAGNASTFTDGTTLPSTNYTYRLTAINFSGASPSVLAAVTTGSAPPPPAQGWVELGPALSTTSEAAQAPSIAVDANGVPTVAYVEFSGGVGRLFVKRFDGTAWQALGGGPLNPGGASGASDPSLILTADGQPLVAFSQGNGQQQNVFVAAFDGSAWQSVGPPGQPLNFVAGAIAIQPSLARAPLGAIAIAWIEDGAARVKAFDGVSGTWAPYATNLPGPTSAGVDAVELALDPAQAPVIVWRETAGGMRTLRAVRGFDLQTLGLVAGPLPSSELRDFGVIVEDNFNPLGTPLVVFAQGDVPWSLHTRRFDDQTWIPLSDLVTNEQPPLLAMAMHRSPTNQGVAYSYDAGGSGSGVFVFRREQSGWAPASTHLFLATVPQLALAMATITSPVVAVVEQSGATFRLRVFRYFP